MDRSRLLELIDGYLDARLNEAELAELSAEVRVSPQARRLYWECAHQHALLAELHAEARGRQLAAQECCSCENHTQPLTPQPPLPLRGEGERRPRRFAALALALALSLLALPIVWLMRPHTDSDDRPAPQPLSLARLGDLRGSVHVLNDAELLPARQGQLLRAGQEVHTGDDGSVVVTYDDDSRLELNADTTVRLVEHSTPGKRVFLVKGVVNATVASQPAGQPLRLSTLEAEFLVGKTRFSAAGILGETRIELEEGKGLLSRKGDNRMIEMSRGTYAISPDMEVYNPVMMVPASSTPFATLSIGSGPVLALASVQGDRTLAVGGWNGLVQLWDIHKRKVRTTLDAGLDRAHALAPSPDGRSLAVGYESRQKRQPTVVIWDLPTATQRLSLPCITKVPSIAFTPDSRSLALICQDRGLRGVMLWDLPNLQARVVAPVGRERLQLGDRFTRAECLAMSPDGRHVAVGCRDGAIRLWDTTTGRVAQVFEGHKREVQALAFRPDGDMLASGSRDGTVKLWSLKSGEELQGLTGRFNEVRCMAFSPDGRSLATGHAGIVLMWDVKMGELRSTLKAHKLAISALVYLDDGLTLATAGWDRSVKLWQLKRMEETN